MKFTSYMSCKQFDLLQIKELEGVDQPTQNMMNGSQIKEFER